MAEDAFADLNTILDGLDPGTSTEQTDPAASTEPTTVTTTEPTEPTEPAKPSGGTQPPAPNTQADASNQAFAAMRAQNSKQAKVLEAVGGLLGLDANLKGDQLYDAIAAKALQDQATKLNTNPEILARMQQQDTVLHSLLQEREKANVFNRFSSLQQELGLTKDQVYTFVGELQSGGYDLTQALDHLPAIYRGMHYQELVEQAANDAVQKALKHDVNASAHSTNPGGVQGKGGTDDDKKIDSVAALDDLLRDVKL